MSILIPTNVTQVTPRWLSMILLRKISSENFVVIPNVQSGSGYLSQMLRIECVEELTEQQLNFIVKLLPDSTTNLSSECRQICISENLDVNEINFYTKIWPDLQALEGTRAADLKKNLCKFYFGLVQENPRKSMLILEDMKPLGYSTKPFADEIQLSQIKQVVIFIAKFHFAASSLQHQKGSKLNEIYPWIQVYWDKLEESTIFKWSLQGLAGLDKFFQSQNCFKLKEKFGKLNGHERLPKLIFQAMNNDHSTLVHDDLWSNNFLIPNDKNKDLPVIVIDFQGLTYGEPTFDLVVLLLSCLPKGQLTRDNVDYFLKLYYDNWMDCYKESGLQDQGLKMRNFEEFSNFFDTFAMAYAFIWFTSHNVHPFEGDLEKLVNIYEFLFEEAKIIEFLLTL